MPSACDQLRALMLLWFGNPIDDYGPSKFLEARGWYIGPPHLITPPVPHHRASEYELACIEFLCDEWDYGLTDLPQHVICPSLEQTERLLDAYFANTEARRPDPLAGEGPKNDP